MARGHKTGGGSRKGVPNKITKTVKEAFEAAFKDAQADPDDPAHLARFRKENPKEFIAACSKLIPAEVKGTMDHTIHAPALEMAVSALGLKK